MSEQEKEILEKAYTKTVSDGTWEVKGDEILWKEETSISKFVPHLGFIQIDKQTVFKKPEELGYSKIVEFDILWDKFSEINEATAQDLDEKVEHEYFKKHFKAEVQNYEKNENYNVWLRKEENNKLFVHDLFFGIHAQILESTPQVYMYKSKWQKIGKEEFLKLAKTCQVFSKVEKVEGIEYYGTKV